MEPSSKAPTVAVVGASADRRKFGNKAVRAYAACGFRVFPINLTTCEIEGFAAYRSVVDVPVSKLDCVSLYVPANIGVELLDDIGQKLDGELWVNPGAESEALLDKAERLGIRTVVACSIVGLGMNPSKL